MSTEPLLPSLELLLDQVASERETMNSHAESLDTKAGVVLGFSGVLVGLGATAQQADANTVLFRCGLGVAVLAALFAAIAFVPRKYPVLEVERLRESNLTASVAETRLELLDTQIEMVREVAALVKQKGGRVQASVVCLALGAALVVAGTLTAGGVTMPESQPAPAPSEQAPSRPAPPPYRPNKDLIGYIERGQQPPTQRTPPDRGSVS